MLIKFFAQGQGAGRGAVEYCTRHDDPISREPRQPAPEVMRGDPALTIALIDGPASQFKHHYTSGVISFAKEDAPTKAEQEALIDSFEATAFSGLSSEQYSILWVRHTHCDRVELHFVVPRVELTSGKSLNIAPPGPIKTDGRRVVHPVFDHWRDYWNHTKGWAKPDDPDRQRLMEPKHLALKSATGLRQGLDRTPDSAQAVTAYLSQQVELGLVNDRASLLASLHDAGLETPRAGKHYITVLDPQTGERYRLRGTLYEQHFDPASLERTPTPETRDRSAGRGEPDPARAREAGERLAESVRKRAEFNRSRYRQDHARRAFEAWDAERQVERNHERDRATGENHDYSRHPELDQTPSDRPEPLSRSLARELGPDAISHIAHSGPDRDERGPRRRDRDPATNAEADRSQDLGDRVQAGRPGAIPGVPPGRPALDGLDGWKAAGGEAWNVARGAYDRARAAIAERFRAAVEAVRSGTAAAAAADRGLVAASAGLEHAGIELDHCIQHARRGVEQGVAVIERNWADELERFKSHINLTEYMAAQGYKLDKAESSRHSAVMRGPGDDKLIVAKGQDGHWVYFSVRDEADNGSIIDFVQRRQALNLGQVRQALRPWIGEAAERPSPAIEHYARIVLPSSPDRQRVACALAKAPPAERHPYLEGRGIEAETLADPRFAGMIRLDARGNAVFPHYDREGLSGYELKNEGFTGFSGGGSKALWHSTNLGQERRLVITESAIDALSHAQLYPDPDTAYISLGGSPSPEQMELARSAIFKAQNRGSKVMVGTDNDPGGEKIAKWLSNGYSGIERELSAYGKDWNEQIKHEMEQAQKQIEQSRNQSRSLGPNPVR